MTETKIVVTTPQKAILTFYTDSFELKEGMIFFIDKKTKTKVGFPTAWCETKEVF